MDKKSLIADASATIIGGRNLGDVYIMPYKVSIRKTLITDNEKDDYPLQS